MTNPIRGLAALISIAGLVALNSCGGADSTGPGCDAIQAALVSRIEVVPGSATVTTGDSVQLRATAFSCAGQLPDVTDFQWRGSNDGIATVSPTGMVKAINSGNATVYASTSGKEGTATVLARPPGVAEVRVEPATLTVGEQQSSSLTARAFDAQGRELIGRTVTWSSALASTVTVDGQGEVTGISAGGPIAVTATIEGKSGASQVTVVRLAVDKVEVSPSSPTIGVAGTAAGTAAPASGVTRVCVVPINVMQAMLGSKIKVKTLDGRRVVLRIPPGTQHGQKFRIPGQGIEKNGRRGDQYVEVRVEIPESLTPEQAAAAQAFAEKAGIKF